MIPLAQIRSRVRTKFEAESDSRWSDAAINAAINEGLDELSERTLFYERYVSIPKAPGQRYYDIRGYVPDGAYALTGLFSTTRNDWLAPVTERGLDNPNQLDASGTALWEESIGDPDSWFVRGAHWFGVYPYPGEDATGYLRLYFAGQAPHFTHDQAVLADLPDDYIPALEEYAMYELHAQDGESKKALLRWKNYDERATEFATFVERRNKTARTHVMGARR